MNNKLTDEDIIVAIDSIVDTLGIKEPFLFESLPMPLGLGSNTKNCIKLIAKHLGLPIEIRLSYVSETYQTSFSKNTGNRFESTGLVETDSKGHGIGGITAQVLIPVNLPMYGTKALENFPIEVRISDNSKDRPTTFVALMAHELCHIVLHSVRYPKKDDEFHTDIAAMILGFYEIMKQGRQTVVIEHKSGYKITTTTSVGYLSDDQFDLAYWRIREIANRRIAFRKSVLKQAHAYQSVVLKFEQLLKDLKTNLAYLDKNLKIKINKSDISNIVSFHQPNYFDGYEQNLKQATKYYEGVNKFCSGLFHHTSASLNQLEIYKRELQINNESLNNNQIKLYKDCRLVGKYMSFTYKLKRVFRNMVAKIGAKL